MAMPEAASIPPIAVEPSTRAWLRWAKNEASNEVSPLMIAPPKADSAESSEASIRRTS